MQSLNTSTNKGAKCGARIFKNFVGISAIELLPFSFRIMLVTSVTVIGEKKRIRIYFNIRISLVRFRTFCFRSPCRILRAVDNILKRKKNAHIPHLGVSPSPHFRIRSSRMGISGDFNLCT